MDDVLTDFQQVLSEERLSAAKDLAGQGVEQGLKIAQNVAGSVLSWYQNLEHDSSIKQVISEERIAAAKVLAERGAGVAQQVLEDERLNVAKEYAEQGAKVAHNVAGSVSEWYQELEPGYLSQSIHGILRSQRFWAWVYMLREWVDWLYGPQAIKLLYIWLTIASSAFFLIYMKAGRPNPIFSSAMSCFYAYAFYAFTPLGSISTILASLLVLAKVQPGVFSAGVLLATFFTGICYSMGV